MKKALILFLLTLSSCGTLDDIATKTLEDMYNIPSSGVSQFDGTKHIRMSNIVCSDIVFELYQDTNKSKDMVLVKAGVKDIENIGRGNALFFKTDNNIYSYEAFSNTTEREKLYFYYNYYGEVSSPFSYKRFLIPEKVIRELAYSNTLLVKINLLNHTFVEARCSPKTVADYIAENDGQDRVMGIKITQKDLDINNTSIGQVGIKKFVEIMDSTDW